MNGSNENTGATSDVVGLETAKLLNTDSNTDADTDDNSYAYDNNYLDYLLIIGKVLRDQCWSLFNHFDLLEQVDRIYPEETYSWRRLLEQPSRILENLYLGSAFNAADYKWLKRHNIAIIVNVTSGISNFYPDEFTYYRFPVEDLESGSLRQYYQTFYELVETNSNSKRILVHCFAGRSRSASLVLYYLAKRYQMTYEQALAYLKFRRPLINLNQEFVSEIQDILTSEPNEITKTTETTETSQV